jgi:hypothetical protein
MTVDPPLHRGPGHLKASRDLTDRPGVVDDETSDGVEESVQRGREISETFLLTGDSR